MILLDEVACFKGWQRLGVKYEIPLDFVPNNFGQDQLADPRSAEGQRCFVETPGGDNAGH